MSGLREIRLPGAPVPVRAHPNDAKARRRLAAAPPTRQLSGLDLGMLTGGAAVLVALAWVSLMPLRANIAVQSGNQALARGDGNAALAAYEQATDLISGSSVYWSKQGALFDQVSQPERALKAYKTAAEQDPYDVNALKTAATKAEIAGDLALARRLFDRAVHLDPLNSQTLVVAAMFELRHEGAARASELLEAAARALPPDPSLLATLGDARAVLGDVRGARAAYADALALDPGQAVALSGLAKLGD